jgi:hypothetical protein
MARNPLRTYVVDQRSTAYSARMAALEELTAPIRKEDLPPDPHERIANLLLSLDAMWSMLEERGVSRDDVHARIAEIRAERAALAGAPERCAHCDAVVGDGRVACQFCGQPVEG